MNGNKHLSEKARPDVRVFYNRNAEGNGPTLRAVAVEHASVTRAGFPPRPTRPGSRVPASLGPATLARSKTAPGVRGLNCQVPKSIRSPNQSLSVTATDRSQYLKSSLVPNDFRGPTANVVRKPTTQPIYPKPEFNPTFFATGNNTFNAIIEIKELWQYVIKEALYNYSEMYSELRVPLNNDVKQTCQKHKEAFAVYDKKNKSWLVPSNEPNYKYCYNGEDFEDFVTAKGKATGNRLLLVGKYSILMQEPNLVRETKITSSMVNSFRRPIVKLIVGVPGCGKTTFIVNNHLRGSLVLTSCAEGAADIRERMGKLSYCNSNNFRDSYRTIDSYLLHSRHHYNKVWIDEALMEHPGKLFLVCLYSGCQLVYMLGDPNQLEYINRVNGIELLYEKTSNFFTATQILNVSYRCPVDVMATISNKYTGGAYSTSDILRSMKCKKFSSLDNVPNEDDTQYLVFKQAEKKEMMKAGYKVSTIHEFQGKEANNVVIVRMSRKLRESLYESAAHILVGMTRHRKSLVYYTPVKDGLHRLINTPLTDEQLLKHKKITELKSSPSVTQQSKPQTNTNIPSRPIYPTGYSNRISSFPYETKEETSWLGDVFFTGVFTVVAVSACSWIWNKLIKGVQTDLPDGLVKYFWPITTHGE